MSSRKNWMSDFVCRKSNVPTMFHGSCLSTPKANLSVCGYLKFWSKKLIVDADDDGPLPDRQVRGVAEVSKVNAGTWAPVQTRSSCSRPVLTKAFETQTYGGRPLKMPTPPRTIICPSPLGSQFRPKRGDQSFPFGDTPVLMPRLSTRPGLVTGLSTFGRSARRPRVKVRRSDGDQASCA